MSDIISFITENWVEIAAALAALILAGERIARITPTETDNKVLQVIRKVANVVGINVPDNPGTPSE